MFARRAGWDLTPNELTRRVAARREAGLPLLDLTDTNPTRCGLSAPAALLAEALSALARDPRALVYEAAPAGLAEARAAVAAHHARAGAAVAPEQVLLTAGTSEGYAHLFRLLADPGDCVLVPQPSYPLFEFLAALEGVETGTYALAWRPGDRRFAIDLDSVARAAGPRTRAVVVVTPHNPTGAVVSPEEARALRAFCAGRGLALVSDEVFADTTGGEAPAPGLLSGSDAEDGPLTFVLSGLSKMLALPQAKLAWIVVSGPAAQRDEAIARLEILADTFLSVNGPFQTLVPRLLAGREAVRRELCARLARNRAALDEALAGCRRVSRLPSEAGWSAIVRVAPTGAAEPPDEEALVLDLLDRDGLLVHPGFFFDLAPDATGSPAAHLVLSLLPDTARFRDGARRLAAAAEAAAVGGGGADGAPSCSSPFEEAEPSA